MRCLKNSSALNFSRADGICISAQHLTILPLSGLLFFLILLLSFLLSHPPHFLPHAILPLALEKECVFSLSPPEIPVSFFCRAFVLLLTFFFVQSSLLVYFKCRKAVNDKQKTREKRRGGRTTKLGEAFRVRFSVNLSTL